MSEASGADRRRPQGRVGVAINGKWHVDARLGSGGMATVYAATHRNGHRAALKMLHTQLSRDESVRARFLREAYVANTVAHPCIVRIEDDDVTEDGVVFLVMELLVGETMETRRMRLGGAMPIDDALEIADQALDALAAAHDKGIVHRDVKPDNVFLTDQGQVKLLDFGLARMKDAGGATTKTGVTIGTPEFMPPEQARGRRAEVDARSDVWGVGAMLFTAITGEYVHNADSLRDQLLASATRRARPIRSIAPHVSPAIASVIDRALELEASDRWVSAREMQNAFRAARGVPSAPERADPVGATVPFDFVPPGTPSAEKTLAMSGPSGPAPAPAWTTSQPPPPSGGAPNAAPWGRDPSNPPPSNAPGERFAMGRAPEPPPQPRTARIVVVLVFSLALLLAVVAAYLRLHRGILHRPF